MASGRTNKEIADQLFLSPHTVKEHTSALYRKLRVRNRAEAVRRAERLGSGAAEGLSTARARVHALDPGGQPRPAVQRQVLHEHVVEGLVVGRLGEGPVPQERVGQAVGGGELAEQVVAARSGVPRTRPARRPAARTGGRLVRVGGPVVDRVGHRVRRALPDLVEPLEEDVEARLRARARSGTAAGRAGWPRGGAGCAASRPPPSRRRPRSTGTRPWPGELDRLAAVGVVDHHRLHLVTPLCASASATRSTLVDMGARTSRTMGRDSPICGRRRQRRLVILPISATWEQMEPRS